MNKLIISDAVCCGIIWVIFVFWINPFTRTDVALSTAGVFFGYYMARLIRRKWK